MSRPIESETGRGTSSRRGVLAGAAILFGRSLAPRALSGVASVAEQYNINSVPPVAQGSGVDLGAAISLVTATGMIVGLNGERLRSRPKAEAPTVLGDLKALDMRDRVNQLEVTPLTLLLASPSEMLNPESLRLLQELTSDPMGARMFEESMSMAARLLRDGNPDVDLTTLEQAILLEKPWSFKNWFPLAPEVAERLGLSTLYAYDGPLARHDQETGYNARGFAEGWANRVLNPDPNNPDDEPIIKFWKENPGARGWLGYCAHLAYAGALEPEPSFRNYIEENIKKGLLIAKHGDDGGIKIDSNIVPQVIRQGKRVVIDLPHTSGRWFRVAFGVNDRGEILVTEFGLAPTYRNPNATVYALLPMYGPGGNSDIRVANVPWGNPELDHEAVDSLVAA